MPMFNIHRMALIFKYRYEQVPSIQIVSSSHLDLGEIELPAKGTRIELVYKPASNKRYLLGNPYCLNFLSQDGASDFSLQLMTPTYTKHRFNISEKSVTTPEGSYFFNKNTFIIERISQEETRFSIPEENIHETINCVNAPTKGFLRLFSQTSTGSYSTVGLVYSFKIFQDNKLILDLVPAVRKPDLKVGFIDTLTNTFYKSNGKNSFLRGE